MVELRLSGVLPFDRGGLDLKRLEQVVEEQYKPLLCFVRDDTRASEFAVGADRHLGRRELEQQIIAGLLERDNRFRDRSSAWTELTLAIKQLAVSGASADAILEELARGEERILQGEETQC